MRPHLVFSHKFVRHLVVRGDPLLAHLLAHLRMSAMAPRRKPGAVHKKKSEIKFKQTLHLQKEKKKAPRPSLAGIRTDLQRKVAEALATGLVDGGAGAAALALLVGALHVDLCAA